MKENNLINTSRDKEIATDLASLMRGGGIVFVGSLLSSITVFLINIILTHTLEVKEYGTFALITTIINIALVISSFGFGSILPKEISYFKEKKKSKKVREILGASLLILAINSTFVVLSLMLLSLFTSIGKYLFIASLSIPFSIIISWFIMSASGFKRVREKFLYSGILSSVVWLILVLIFAFFKMLLIWLFIAFTLSKIIVLILCLSDNFFRSIIKKLHEHINMQEAKRLAVTALPVFITNIVGILTMRIDTLIIAYFIGKEATGLYNIGNVLGVGFNIVFTSITFLFPAIAAKYIARKDFQGFNQFYKLIVRWSFVISLPFLTLVLLYPSEIIRIIFGSKYLPATPIIQWIALAYLFHILAGPNGLSLIILEENKVLFMLPFFSLLIATITNLILVPTLGINGAALSFFIVTLLSNTFVCIYLFKKYNTNPLSVDVVKSIIAVLISIIITKKISLLINLTNSILKDVFLLMMFLLLYLIILISQKFIKQQDIDFIKEILRAVKERM